MIINRPSRYHVDTSSSLFSSSRRGGVMTTYCCTGIRLIQRVIAVMKTRRKDIACQSFAPRKHNVCTSVKLSLLSSRRRRMARTMDRRGPRDFLRPSSSSRLYTMLFNIINNNKLVTIIFYSDLSPRG